MAGDSDSRVPLTFHLYQDGRLLRTEVMDRDVVKIGSHAGSHLRIDDDDGVSRIHAVVDATKGVDEVELIDLDSTNGTIVNGKRINKCLLQTGHEILIGNTKLVVEIGDPAEGADVDEEAPTAVAPSALPRPEEAAAAPVPPAPAPAASPVPPAPAPAAPIPSTLQQQPFDVPSAPPAAAPASDVQTGPALPVEVVASEDMFQVQPSGGIEGTSSVESQSGAATEVVTIWQGSVLDVQHYMHAGKPATFAVGEDPRSNIWIMPELIGGGSFAPLVVTAGGGSEIHVLPGMTGEVTMQDGSKNDLMAATGGGSTFGLPSGGRARLEMGDFTFLVNSVLPGKVPPAPLNADWSAWVYTGFSFLVHAIAMFLVYFIPPDPRSLSLDMLAEDNRFVRYILEPPEIQQEEIEDWVNQDNRDDEQGGKGKRHKGEEGQMGRQDAKKSDNRFGIKGPADNPDPHMARERAKEYAAQAGILSVLRSAAPTSPFGQDSALGNDPENALGALMGNQIGDNFGYGGLGLRGTGRGGGGTGEGTIGLGNLATIGHGGGGGSGSGYGRGAGGLRGRRASVPRIRTGTAAVRGSLSKEVIRRYIRRHINQIRFCYEQQLARRPDLSGRVAVRFVISPSGAVSTASVAGSTMGSPPVEQCVARAVQRIAFPQPEGGGVVIVTYPFMFQSAEGG